MGGVNWGIVRQNPNTMKTVQFNYRLLLTMMVLGTFLLNADDVLGQIVCSTCQTSCTIGAVATGACAFAAGESAQSDAANSICIGYKSNTEAVRSLTFGNLLGTSSGRSDNMVIGFGYSGTLFSNSISNSIMIGVNSNVSTVYIGDSGGTSGSYGNVGIGNITSPASLLHIRDEVRLGLTSNASGSLVFNNIAGNTLTINTPASLSTHVYTLPAAQATTADQVLTNNGSGTLSWEDGAEDIAWLIDGNDNIDDATNFLGTTNAKDLVIKTNGDERMRVLSNGRVGIGTDDPQTRFDVLVPGGLQGNQERIARFGVSDQPNAFFQIWNKATDVNHFAPSFYGISSTEEDEGLDFRATLLSTSLDDGSTPVMSFTSRYYNIGGTITDRPLFQWRNNSTVVMHMAANGNLGVGTASPDSKLTVDGDISPETNNTYNLGTGTSDRWNTIYYSTLMQGSDDRIKQNIAPLQYGLDELLQLNPISYELIPPLDSLGQVVEEAVIGEQFGLSAQSLQSILPQLVHEDGDSMNLRSVRYVELIPVLINSIKEQNEQIRNLTDELAQVRSDIVSCCGGVEPAMRMRTSENPELDEVILFRNDPNPFSAWTDIQYEVENGSQLSILFTDVSGRIVKRISLENAKGVIRVYGADLDTGQYFYSLLVGKNIVRTERMIVAK
jgi:hypothetical protein